MITPELITDVKKYLAAGEDEVSIKQNMLEAGHDEAVAEAALQQAKLQLASEPTPPNGQPGAEREAAPATAQSPHGFASASTVPARSAWQLVELSLRKTFAQPGVIVAYGLASLLVFVVAGILGGGGYLTGDISVMVLGIVLAITAAVVLMVINTLALLITVVRGEGVTYWQAWQQAWPLLWQFLVLGLVSTLVVMLGFVFLIIPGLVISIYIFLAQIVFIKEGHRGAAALARSTELIYGRWWGTLGRFLLLLLIFFAANFVLGFFEESLDNDAAVVISTILGFLVQMIFTVAIINLTYLWYQERAQVVGIKAPAASTVKKFKIAAWFGVIAMFIMPLLLGGVVYSQLDNALELNQEAFERSLEQQMEVEQMLEEEGLRLQNLE